MGTRRGNQFVALLHKNLVLLRRRKLNLVIWFVVPIISIALVGLAHFVVDNAAQDAENSFVPEYSLPIVFDRYMREITDVPKMIPIVFWPVNQWTEAYMGNAAAKLNLTYGVDAQVQPWLRQDPDGKLDPLQYLAMQIYNRRGGFVDMIVYFAEPGCCVDPKISNVSLDFTVMFNDTFGSYYGANGKDPMAKSFGDLHVQGRKIAVQLAVQHGIMKYFLPDANLDVSYTGFDSVPIDPTVNLMATELPQSVTLSFGPIFYQMGSLMVLFATVNSLMEEKTTRIKYKLQSMGLHEFIYIISIYSTELIKALIASLIIPAIGMIFPLYLFRNTNYFVLVLAFFLYFASLTAFATFICSIYRRVMPAYIFTIATVCMAVSIEAGFDANTLNFVQNNTVYVSLYNRLGSSVPTIVNVLLFLFPYFNFGGLIGIIQSLAIPGFSQGYFGIADLGTPVAGSRKYQWTPNGEGYFEVQTVTASWYVLGLFVDFFLYSFLAWWCGQVWAGETGRARPVLFLFSPSYWIGPRKLEIQPGDTLAIKQELSQQNHSIVLHKVSKVFENKRAVKELSMEIKPNSVFCLLGHNGAGKTTTINMLTGVHAPSHGNAFMFGHNIGDSQHIVRELIGVCEQEDILWPKLTAEEHLHVFATFMGCDKSSIAPRIHQELQDVQLVGSKDQMAGTYSGGMKRRLSIAISSIGHPEILFLDEPTTGMDPVNKRAVWDKVRKYREGHIVVLTTHSMEEADVLGDEIAIMSDGRLRAIGSALFLKNNFGGGYLLHFLCYPGRSANLLEMLKEAVVGLDVMDHSAEDLTVRVPRQERATMPAVFALISQNKQHIKDWGVSQTTLEDVFMKLAVQAQDVNAGADIEIPCRLCRKAPAELVTLYTHLQHPVEVSGILCQMCAFRMPKKGGGGFETEEDADATESDDDYESADDSSDQDVPPNPDVAVSSHQITSAKGKAHSPNGGSSYGTYGATSSSSHAGHHPDGRPSTETPLLAGKGAGSDFPPELARGGSAFEQAKALIFQKSIPRFQRQRKILVFLICATMFILATILALGLTSNMGRGWQDSNRYDTPADCWWTSILGNGLQYPLSTEITCNSTMFQEAIEAGLVLAAPNPLITQPLDQIQTPSYSNWKYAPLWHPNFRNGNVSRLESTWYMNPIIGGSPFTSVQATVDLAGVNRRVKQVQENVKAVGGLGDLGSWGGMLDWLTNGTNGLPYASFDLPVFDPATGRLGIDFGVWWPNKINQPPGGVQFVDKYPYAQVGYSYSGDSYWQYMRPYWYSSSGWTDQVMGSWPWYGFADSGKGYQGGMSYQPGMQSDMPLEATVRSSTRIFKDLSNMFVTAFLKEAVPQLNFTDFRVFAHEFAFPNIAAADPKSTSVLIITALLPLATLFTLPIFVSEIAEDHMTKSVDLMQMMGLRWWVYWLGTFGWHNLFGLGVAVFYAFVSVGANVVTISQVWMAFVLFLGWGQAVSGMATFVSALLFHSMREATALSFLMVALFGPLCGVGVVFFKWHSGAAALPAVLYLFPPVVYADSIWLMTTQSFGSEFWVCIAALFIMGILLNILGVMIYYTAFHGTAWLKNAFGREGTRRTNTAASETEPPLLGEDSDVVEMKHVTNGLVEDKVEKALIVHRLMKAYPFNVVQGQTYTDARVDVEERTFKAVRSVSLYAEEGNCLGMLGPNGAGKTTTLSMVTGHILPTRGSILVGGNNLLEKPLETRRYLGVCPQENVLWPDLSVQEHLATYARLKGVPIQHLSGHVRRIAEVIRLDGDEFNQPSRELSGGMKRRLCIGVAMVGNPLVVLLDEPTTGLDPESRRMVWKVITDAKRERCVVLTTHSMEEAEALCERILIMTQGRLRCVGTQLHLKSKYGSGYKIVITLRREGDSTSSSPAGSPAGAAAVVQSGVPPAHVGNAFSQIEETVRRLSPSLEPLSMLGYTRGYAVKQEDVDIEGLFRIMETSEMKRVVADWALSMCTMDDVFIKIVMTDPEGKIACE